MQLPIEESIAISCGAVASLPIAMLIITDSRMGVTTSSRFAATELL
jgi:hypothetical protein